MSPVERNRLFFRLFNAHRRAMCRVAWRVLCKVDPMGVDDVVQLTFIKCWRSFNPALVDSFRYWVLRAVQRNAFDHSYKIRTPLRHHITLDTEAVENEENMEEHRDPCARLVHRDQVKLLREALAATSHPRARRIFELYVLEHRSYKEIPELVGVRPGTVMSSLHRTRAKVVAYIMEKRERYEIFYPSASAA